MVKFLNQEHDALDTAPDSNPQPLDLIRDGASVYCATRVKVSMIHYIEEASSLIVSMDMIDDVSEFIYIISYIVDYQACTLAFINSWRLICKEWCCFKSTTFSFKDHARIESSGPKPT